MTARGEHATCDALLVICTRGAVLLVGGMARAFKGRAVLANLEASECCAEGDFDEVCWGPVTESVPRLIELARQREPGHSERGPPDRGTQI